MWKKSVEFTSVISLLVAALMIFFGIKAITGHSVFIGLAVFSMAKSGTMMAFVGNLMGIFVAGGGFGIMGLSGIAGGEKGRRTGLISGFLISIICIISLICSICSHNFSLGDILITALPIIYSLGVINSD